jgi:head-tail adaptor
MKSKISVAALRHRISLCTMQDVVVDGDEMRLTRKEVFGAWAAIETKRGSMFATGGVVIQEAQDVQSHLITIRYRYDYTISSAAWVFEQRLKSEPRWYKILSVKDTTSEWWVLSCRLVEKSDLVSQPQPDTPANPFLVGKPQGVKL